MSRRAAIALLGALICASAAVLTWAAAFRTGIGHSADTRLLAALSPLQETRAEPLMTLVASVCNPLPYALLALIVTGAALVLRGAWAAVVTAALLVIPNAVAQVLKRELAEDRSGPVASDMHVEAAAWPSGHSTAAMSLALAVLLIVPGRWKPAAAIAGLAFALAMGGSVVALGWHFPSDVAGGLAVAGAGACVAAALLSRRAATAALPSRWRLARG